MSDVATVTDDKLEGFGNPFSSRYTEAPFPKDTVIKMYTGNLSDPGDCAIAEYILTKSLRCGGYLNKRGDIAVFERTGTFDKMGDYHIYLYYAMLPEQEKKAESNAQ